MASRRLVPRPASWLSSPRLSWRPTVFLCIAVDPRASGTGGDLLIGGAGNDTLAGGPGADTFHFDGTDFGEDWITDFTLGEDKLEFAGVGTADEDDLVLRS